MQTKKMGAKIAIPFSNVFSINISNFINILRGYADYFAIIFSCVTSFLGWKFYFNKNLVLSYNDAMSHLDIARRVVEGLKPGFAQIGSVWLPLPHILSLPFIWNDFLWHSGLAGSIVSGLAFVGSAYLIFKLVKVLTGDAACAFLGMLIFAINPNMVYMQATPMTESLLLFFFIASCYFLLLWQKSDDYKYLLLSAVFTLGSTLVRYDGWMLLAQIFFTVLIISFRKGGYRKTEGNIFLFSTLAIYGVILWLIWNKLIFGDYLYFVTGPFSAKAQQQVFEAEGRLFSKGNLLYSIFIYLMAVIKNNGALFFMFSTFGGLVYFLQKKFSSEALVVLLLFSPLIFNVSALYFGHSIINIPDFPPHTLFNVRYGLMMLPAIAVFTSYLVRKQILLNLLIVLFLLIQTFTMYQSNQVITVADGISGASAQGMAQTGKWLGGNAKDGLILIASSSQDSLIFLSGLPMKRFITEGTGDYWTESLKDPTSHAAWIAMHHGDSVYREIASNPNFLNNYEKVYDGEFTDIFKFSPQISRPLTAEDLP